MKYTRRIFGASSIRDAIAFLLSFFVFSIATSRVVLAQSAITLTSANVPLTTGAHTELSLNLAGLAVPATGANQTWDYSAVLIGASSADELFASTDKSFSSTAIFDTIGSDILVTSGGKTYGVLYNEFFDQGSSSIVEPGIFMPAQSYYIGEISGGSTDSLWAAAQDAVFTTPEAYIAFPATMGSIWGSTGCKRSVALVITLANFGLIKAPFDKVSSFTIADTIVGWGTLKVPAHNGASAPTAVLMDKKTVIRVDSFYLSGSPAPTLLLGAFGLTQAGVTETYSYRFLAQGSMLPLLKIDYSDANLTQAKDAESFQAASLGVAEGTQAEPIQVYPNPAVNNLRIKNASGPFTILDPLGRSYDTGQSGSTLDISSLPPGVYFVSDGTWREKFVKQ